MSLSLPVKTPWRRPCLPLPRSVNVLLPFIYENRLLPFSANDLTSLHSISLPFIIIASDAVRIAAAAAAAAILHMRQRMCPVAYTQPTAVQGGKEVTAAGRVTGAAGHLEDFCPRQAGGGAVHRRQRQCAI